MTLAELMTLEILNSHAGRGVSRVLVLSTFAQMEGVVLV